MGEKRLLEKWKQLWKAEENPEFMPEFYNLYISVYQDVQQKLKDNKKKNMCCKKGFFVVSVVFFVAYIILFIWKGRGTVADLGFVLIVFIWLETIIAKWIDIKKYQETWARHSWDLYMMEREMLLFICGIEPYNNTDRYRNFVKRIIEIWDKNEEKFVYNLEEKEKDLMDVFKRGV